MPFKTEDVERHNRGLSDSKKAQWVAVANSVLKKCMEDGGDDASCAPKAIRQANGVVAANDMHIHVGGASNYTIRKEFLQGKEHIIVPIIMMVTGVHRGSHGPILHLAEELGKFPGCWDGIPVSIQHPQEDGMHVSANQPHILDEFVVGRVFNTMMDGQKLRAEAWLDPVVLKNISPEAMEYIMEGKPLEVSVGVFTDEDMRAGEWNGEKYEAVARNHRPDHLALLPGAVGACSWSDGCGVRTHQEGESNMKTDAIEAYEEFATPDQIKQLIMEGVNISINEIGYSELRNIIQAKLDRMDDDAKAHYLEDIFDGYIIYRVEARGNSQGIPPVGTSDGKHLFKRNYTAADDGTVEFTGESMPVIKKTEYVTTNEGGHEMPNNNKQPCCEEKVQMLIEAGTYTEEHRERLLAMEEADIDILMTSTEKKAELKAKIEELQAKLDTMQANAAQATTRDKAIEVLKEDLGDKDKFLALAPKEIRSTLEHGLRLHQDERNRQIAHIMANTNEGVYTKERLEAMDDQDLSFLAQAIKAPVDYSGQAPTPQVNRGGHEAQAVYPPDVV